MKMWRNSNLYTLLVGMQNGTVVESCTAVSQKKKKIELTYDPAIPLLGVYSMELPLGCQRNICTPCS